MTISDNTGKAVFALILMFALIGFMHCLFDFTNWFNAKRLQWFERGSKFAGVLSWQHFLQDLDFLQEHERTALREAQTPQQRARIINRAVQRLQPRNIP